MSTANARFLRRFEIDPESNCWIWTGGLTHNGYGQFSIGARNVRAHRFAYELFVGPIPHGMEIDHVRERGCTSRACVNPDHLEVVTSAENTLRGFSPSAENARKTHCIHGHPFNGWNTHIRPDGARRCRACNAESRRRARARQRIAA